MWDAIGAMDTIEKIFLASAVLGGGMFLIRLVMLIMGGDLDSDVGDVDVDVDVDVGDMDVGDADAGDVDVDADGADASHAAFKLLSLQGISGFLLMFGLVGLGISRTTEAAKGWALAGGCAAGIITMWLLAKLMFMLMKLQSSGTLDLANGVGEEGQVYLTIPAGGIGKVQVVIQERLQIVEARGAGEETIKTGDRVKVVKLVDGRTFVVTKI